MKFRKSVSLVLVASQVALGSVAWASAVPAPTASAPSAEFTLVENILALQGLKLSPAEVQTQANSLLGTYLANAQTDGSQQRLEQALVDLGLYTPEQAQAFVADSQSASARVLAGQPVMPEQAQSLISTEMSQLAAVHPTGAQFSARDFMDADTSACVGTIAATAGFLAVVTGLTLRFDNPTCTTQTYTGTTCYTDGGGCTFTTVAGPTTCTEADYYPHAQAGDDVMIGGGIALGVGALLMILAGEGGC